MTKRDSPERKDMGYAVQVARALHSRPGPGLDAVRVAQALHARRGLNLNAGQVARALEDGLELSREKARKIAEALPPKTKEIHPNRGR